MANNEMRHNRDPGTLEILQLNCQRCEAVMLDVCMMMNECMGEVWLLQEPYIRGGAVYGLENFVVFSLGDHPKSAVVLSSSRLQGQLLVDISTELATFVKIWCSDLSFIVGSIYCQYGADIGDSLVFVERPPQLFPGMPILLGLDANASSGLWFSKNRAASYERDRRGETLAESLIRGQWTVLNIPMAEFTYAGPNGSSDIDVTVVNHSFLDTFMASWRVRSELGVSDHNPLTISLKRRGGQDMATIDLGVSIRESRIN